MEYIGGLFKDYGVSSHTNLAFTLQNGADSLSKVFAKVTRYDYEDSLAVTNLEDMADYVYSLMGMSELRQVPRETMLEVLAKHATNGVLLVPKEYGMFVAS
jgi:hypothetical protein